MFSKTAPKGIRFGWVVPKKIGSAVVRNKVRRWLKEYIRTLLVDQLVEAEYVFIFHSNFSQIFSKIDYKEFCSSVKAGVELSQDRLKSREPVSN